MNCSSLIHQTLQSCKFLTYNIVIKLLEENMNEFMAKEQVGSALHPDVLRPEETDL